MLFRKIRVVNTLSLLYIVYGTGLLQQNVDVAPLACEAIMPITDK